jgi:hypothetical protein
MAWARKGCLAREGLEQEVAAALAAVIPPTRAEAGCLSIEAYRANADGRLFFLCSHWSMRRRSTRTQPCRLRSPSWSWSGR